MKLIENLPNHLKDKKEYLLNLKDSIDIPIACFKCRKYRHHVTECEKNDRSRERKMFYRNKTKEEARHN